MALLSVGDQSLGIPLRFEDRPHARHSLGGIVRCSVVSAPRGRRSGCATPTRIQRPETQEWVGCHALRGIPPPETLVVVVELPQLRCTSVTGRK